MKLRQCPSAVFSGPRFDRATPPSPVALTTSAWLIIVMVLDALFPILHPDFASVGSRHPSQTGCRARSSNDRGQA